MDYLSLLDRKDGSYLGDGITRTMLKSVATPTLNTAHKRAAYANR